jgi:uncharacterized delta-60 repeat protein
VAVARYQPNGSLDESFAEGGRTFVGVRGSDIAAHALALQADGKLVLTGECLDVESNSLDAIVMRLDPKGTLDPTFNGNGIALTEFLPGSDDKAYAVVIQDDGGIVIGGYTTETTGPQPDTTAGDKRLRSEAFALARYTSEGVLDPGFGEAGLVITRFAGDLARVLALCLDPVGRILATGLVRSDRPDAAGATDLIVARYLPDGKVDPSFGIGGHAVVDLERTDDTPEAITVDADGRIVVAGSAVRPDSQETHFLVVRLDPNGTLDPTFDDSGTLMTEIFDGVARAIAVQADGGILVSGYGRCAEPAADAAAADKDRLAVVRYLPDGTLDPVFGDAGVVWLDLGGQSDRAYAAALQDDGKLVVAGTSRSGDVGYFILVRLLAGEGGEP